MTRSASAAPGPDAVRLAFGLLVAFLVVTLGAATIALIGLGEFSADCPSSKHLAQVWRGVNGERASSGVGF